MRLALISDIHGNGVALDAVLADLGDDADLIVCLGDALQGGAEPAEVVARLREMECAVIMGNADAWLLGGLADDPAEPVTAKQRAVGEWTLAQLSKADLLRMRGFVPTLEVSLRDAGDALLFHGSPRSFNELIFPETPNEEVVGMLNGASQSLFAGGHTHTQQIRRVGESIFVNPGSVGVVYERNQTEGSQRYDPWAEYAVVSTDHRVPSVEFRRVPYDLDELARVAHVSGRPHADEFMAGYSR